MSFKGVQQILASAEQSLEFARQAADDFRRGGDRRVSGLFNFATSSRTVTFVLQNMRGHVDGFDAWYEPVKARLADDPVARWAKDLRNRVEKQGDPGARFIRVESMTLDFGQLAAATPPGTISTVIGDSWGRNYWVIQLEDGSEQKLFFNLPPSMGGMDLRIEGAPEGRSVGDLMDAHLSTLDDIVGSAREHFAP